MSADLRRDFSDTWLSSDVLLEMPRNMGDISMENVVISEIKEKSEYFPVIDLGNNFKKIEGAQLVYYWYEKNNDILLAAAFTKKPMGLIVNGIEKTTKGQPPYASELYLAVLIDRRNMPLAQTAIRIVSDKLLSNDSIKTWKRFINAGHQISVYDSDAPGQTFEVINTVDDLDAFVGDETKRRYQFILTEAIQDQQEVKSQFMFRRWHELSGLL